MKMRQSAAALALCLALAGCGGDGAASPDSAAQSMDDSAAAVDETAVDTAGDAGSADSAGVSDETDSPADAVPYLLAGDPAAENVYRVAVCCGREELAAEAAVTSLRSRLDEIGRERNALFALAVGYARDGESRDSDEKAAGKALSRAVSNLPDGGADLLAGIGVSAAVVKGAPETAARKNEADTAGESSEEAASDTAEETASDTAEETASDTAEETASDTAEEAASDTAEETADTAVKKADEIPAVCVSGLWDAEGMVNLLMAAEPGISKVGILYNQEDAAAVMEVREAVARFQAHGVEIVERTGSTSDEVQLAAMALAADGVGAVFTPQDAAVLDAEQVVSNLLTEAGIPHYAGSYAFAEAGAYLGYGVFPHDLGREAADRTAAVLLDGGEPGDMAEIPPSAAVNARTCTALGRDAATVQGTPDMPASVLLIPGE